MRGAGDLWSTGGTRGGVVGVVTLIADDFVSGSESSGYSSFKSRSGVWGSCERRRLCCECRGMMSAGLIPKTGESGRRRNAV